MKSFQHYKDAFSHANELASQSGKDVGILKAKEFNSTVFQVFRLPAPEFRSGFELRCEVVTPNTPRSR